MIDKITLASKRGTIRPEIVKLLVKKGLPSHSYSKAHCCEVSEVEFKFNFLRHDQETLGNKSFKVSVNGFDVGSFARACQLIKQIAEFDPHDLMIDSIELSLDILVTPNAIQHYLVYKNFNAFKRIYRNKINQFLMFENSDPESETWEVGDRTSNSLIVYNKLLELIERKHVPKHLVENISCLTRLEERFGGRYFATNPVNWSDLAEWLEIKKPFEGLQLLNVPMLPPNIDRYSLEAFATYGFLSYMKDKNVPAKMLLQKMARNAPWESAYLDSLLKCFTSYQTPPFSWMFYLSVGRFFTPRTEPLSSLAFSLDGGSHLELPHQIIRGKFKRSRSLES
jgi:hypothetical protein